MLHTDRGISDANRGALDADRNISDADHGILDTKHGISDADHGVQPGHWPFIHCNTDRGGSAPGMVRLLNACLKAHRGSNFVKIRI